MLIYEYSNITAYATGNSLEIADDAAIPLYWTTDPIPPIPAGSFARFNFPGWVITTDPAPIYTPPAEPMVPQSPPNIIV